MRCRASKSANGKAGVRRRGMLKTPNTLNRRHSFTPKKHERGALRLLSTYRFARLCQKLRGVSLVAAGRLAVHRAASPLWGPNLRVPDLPVRRFRDQLAALSLDIPVCAKEKSTEFLRPIPWPPFRPCGAKALSLRTGLSDAAPWRLAQRCACE